MRKVWNPPLGLGIPTLTLLKLQLHSQVVPEQLLNHRLHVTTDAISVALNELYYALAGHEEHIPVCSLRKSGCIWVNHTSNLKFRGTSTGIKININGKLSCKKFNVFPGLMCFYVGRFLHKIIQLKTKQKKKNITSPLYISYIQWQQKLCKNEIKSSLSRWIIIWNIPWKPFDYRKKASIL